MLGLIPTGVLTSKPEMQEGGQRTQPLGIRLQLLEPIADLLDHLIKRVQSQMWHLLFAQFLPVFSDNDCATSAALETCRSLQLHPYLFCNAALSLTQCTIYGTLCV